MIPFGSVPYSSLLAFCGGLSLDDNCMGHGIALLQRENPNVGVVNPLFMRFELREQQHTAIKADNPFVETNKIVLIPLHVDNNHWCGAVLDFRKDSRVITVFDPLQASK
ncbi:Ulp1 protease family, C-terminal catalytic domain [Phytophthora cactorum]|nr:Ulp1 protease family, C-terminal catalytic domain [Phytophthora cactorum]